LLTPLVLSGLLIRWTPIVDRYVASGLPEGTISQLGYAYRILNLITLFLASGITTVLFPRMAMNMAVGDRYGLGQTISLGLRLMWLAVAPAIAFTIVLAPPLITVVFRRGAFSVADARAVATLLQVYAVALVATCLGNMTSRAFYALKDMRTVAVMGVVEAAAYAVYTPLLARGLGAQGVAWAYVIYFTSSLVWQIVILHRRLRGLEVLALASSLARTGMAAAVGGGAAWAVYNLAPQAWLALIVGGLSGLAAYGAALLLLGSSEVRTLRGLLAKSS
jgi:putative peptidoglycan lipid II flippase